MEKPPRLNESIEHNQYEPSDKALCSFLHLTPEHLASFRDRIAGVGGHLRIWVHPLYTEQWPATTQGRLGDANLVEVQNKLRNTFFKTIVSVARNPNSSPLVVYEAIKKIEETKRLVAEKLECRPEQLEELGIVFVPTEAGSSFLDTEYLIDTLKTGDISDIEEATKLARFKNAVTRYVAMKKQLQLSEIASAREEYFDAIDNMHLKDNDFMVSLFKRIGMKSALVSGAYLEVGRNYKTMKPELRACAGGVATYLREAGFPTDISSNIWPPKELIKEAGLEVKQTGQVSDVE